MNHVQSLLEIHDMEPIARDLGALMCEPKNLDLMLDFPGTVLRFTREPAEVVEELLDIQYECSEGKKERFVIFAGKRAVGMSAIQIQKRTPDGVEESIPNLSGFICNPYRGKGLGRLSLNHRLAIIDQRYDGKAYTEIRHDNHISQNMFEKIGWQLIGSNDTHLTYLRD